MASLELDSTVRRLVEDVPFNRHLGLIFAGKRDGGVRVLLPNTETTSNHIGTTHASAIFAVAEVAAGAAVAAALHGAIASVVCVASGARIQYVRPSRGDIIAFARLDAKGESAVRAQLEEVGKSQLTVFVTVANEHDQKIAEAEIDWFIKLDRKSIGAISFRLDLPENE